MPESAASIALFAKFISRSMGLHFAQERLFELEQKMAAVARDAGYPEVEQYLTWLMSTPLSREQLETLARALTIGETYFLRDPRSYQVLEQQLLPGLVAQRRATERSLRFWSAGCSTGEEPYTLAILLSRIIPDLANWKISLLATDINPQALERGRQGIYSQWSFRNAPPWLMEYFTKTDDGRYQIIPRIKNMVRFEYLNLADDRVATEGGGTDFLDVIFCRNVMLYFEPEQIERTMAKFHSALGKDGWLFVGPTEVDQNLIKGFTCRRFTGAFVLSKGAASGQSTALPHPALQLPDIPALTQAATQSAAHLLAKPSLPGVSQALGSRTSGTQAGDSSGTGPKLESPASDFRQAGSAASPSAAASDFSTVASQPGAAEGNDYSEALALYRDGHYQLAADSVRRALAAGPQPAETLSLGARALANIGRLAEARELCEHAIAADRLAARNHYLLSVILEQQGDLPGAASSLKNVLFIDHDHLLAYFALGNLSRQAGDARESERNFNNALKLLEKLDPHELLPEAEGMTAGSLAQMIRGMTKGRSAYGKG
jgi:chemotaxis protein methyltransferase CheR